MHFSSPSGQRLSWWRPWNRGAVGFFSKGYCSVTTFLNIVRKVTPNPATGSQNCSLRLGTCILLVHGGDRCRRLAGQALARHRRHRVAAGEGVELLLRLLLLL